MERRRAGRGAGARQRRHRAAPDQRHGAERRRDGAARGRLRLREDESGFCAVTWGDGDLGGPRSAPEALERLDSTEEFWRDWLRAGDFPDHPWRIHLQRSALVLKGLTYTPDRGDRRRPDHLAAGDPRRRTQLGLPLQLDPRLDLHPLGPAHARLRPGGARLHALHRSTSAGTTPTCRSCTGSAARSDLTESTLDHLGGYGGARPVRIGNGAYDQRQNDVWGALLDSIYLHEKALRGSGTQADRELIRHQVEAAIEAWPNPDQGIWESRGEPKHYVSSKLMIWVAVDRGARLAREHRHRRAGRRVAGARQMRSRRRSSSAASATASSASTTRPTRSTPPPC